MGETTDRIKGGILTSSWRAVLPEPQKFYESTEINLKNEFVGFIEAPPFSNE